VKLNDHKQDVKLARTNLFKLKVRCEKLIIGAKSEKKLDSVLRWLTGNDVSHFVLKTVYMELNFRRIGNFNFRSLAKR
jgi:hypothetical protein